MLTVVPVICLVNGLRRPCCMDTEVIQRQSHDDPQTRFDPNRDPGSRKTKKAGVAEAQARHRVVPLSVRLVDRSWLNRWQLHKLVTSQYSSSSSSSGSSSSRLLSARSHFPRESLMLCNILRCDEAYSCNGCFCCCCC